MNKKTTNKLREIMDASHLKYITIAKCLGYSHNQSVYNALTREHITNRTLLKFCKGYIMHLKNELAAMQLLEKRLDK